MILQFFPIFLPFLFKGARGYHTRSMYSAFYEQAPNNAGVVQRLTESPFGYTLVKGTDTHRLLLLSSSSAGTSQRAGVLFHQNLELPKSTVKHLKHSLLAKGSSKGWEPFFTQAIETTMLLKTTFKLLLMFCYF